ncbi:hypothetical protein HSBAA_41650 [Vreelandella sulfidaeris]|uniref:Uncharacterized protein n=1 Tax=Vreelandella sulfidaeris TaxID=115553 RepID=A0A455UF14_9GAMM|nr:hypothetical protein HSBAA_41650 [Halomonas sulfidaeris]
MFRVGNGKLLPLRTVAANLAGYTNAFSCMLSQCFGDKLAIVQRVARNDFIGNVMRLAKIVLANDFSEQRLKG